MKRTFSKSREQRRACAGTAEARKGASNRRNLVSRTDFRSGELYLFHRSDARCPASGSLWGQYDRQSEGLLYLESSSADLRTFRLWHALPSGYRYCRPASRSELRDYFFALSWYQSRRAQPPAHDSYIL